jgi:putative transposase
MWLYFHLFRLALRVLSRDRRGLVPENLALRQQRAVFERRGRRPILARADRRFWSRLAPSWQPWRQHLLLVLPDTVVRWHRTAWRIHWPGKSQARGLGRPRLGPTTIGLIQRLGREDLSWGTRRIQGALRQPGGGSRSTIQRYAARPQPSPSWRTFLRLHAAEIWACDFFTVLALTFRTLHVFFVITHDRHTLTFWSVTRHPTAAWVGQQIREATPRGM